MGRQPSKRKEYSDEPEASSEDDASDQEDNVTKSKKKRINEIVIETEEVDVRGLLSSEKSISEAGQILSVYVENFMCHRKFELKFGRHLNFVTGRNGSGIILS